MQLKSVIIVPVKLTNDETDNILETMVVRDDIEKETKKTRISTNIEKLKQGEFRLQILKEFREKTGTNCSRFQALKIKDLFNQSDNHYRLFRKLLNLTLEMPALCSLIDLRSIYNINFKINSNYYGAFNYMPYKLRSILLPIAVNLKYFENLNLSKNMKKSNAKFLLKLCGTQVGRVKKL